MIAVGCTLTTSVAAFNLGPVCDHFPELLIIIDDIHLTFLVPLFVTKDAIFSQLLLLFLLFTLCCFWSRWWHLFPHCFDDPIMMILNDGIGNAKTAAVCRGFLCSKATHIQRRDSRYESIFYIGKGNDVYFLEKNGWFEMKWTKIEMFQSLMPYFNVNTRYINIICVQRTFINWPLYCLNAVGN